jgi:hypothetical protein
MEYIIEEISVMTYCILTNNIIANYQLCEIDPKVLNYLINNSDS